MFGVKEFRINFIWSKIAWQRKKETKLIYILSIKKMTQCGPNRPILTLTDHKDLSRLIPGGLWLGGLNLLEEMLEDPEQRLVVFGAEDLCDEGSTFV